ncbi:MAG: hypothetical protein ACQEUY_13160 [Pseudomonadota bacterium]
MSEYTQGVCQDGAAILKDGQPLTIEQILEALRERDALAAHIERLNAAIEAWNACRVVPDNIDPLIDAAPATSLHRRVALAQAEALRNAAEDFKEGWPEHTGKYHWMIGVSCGYQKIAEGHQ